MLSICNEQKLSGGRRQEHLLKTYWDVTHLEASLPGRSGVGVYGVSHHTKSYKPKLAS